MRIKVKGRDDLVRDSQSMAILNIDSNVLHKDLLYKQKLKKEKETEEAINKLETDVKEIKNSLDKILQVLESRGP